MPNFRTSRVLPVLSALLIVSLPGTALAGTQQDKMRSCNKDAKEKALKGDERRTFMKSCLSSSASAKPATPDEVAAQAALKACRADAKEKALKGDERKAFIKDCLKT
ncbi:MAG: phosphate starvation-inducible protein PsiF [Gammaproteobacteria bacterium]|jgi:hypothetical protein|nr:phosphate starvation-inducible protein PsiF [Gammaproteobacteria bacterium]MBU0770304.1 phosphate starvation-inducible protein PsiF [Gammaproteobacteria bacterium]MBU0857246.1 phosphate starvation-inducible protein PsiF [Gammaproteobacteria bacterium]MBU1847921.1 phosphate starvation-inducible protein PsiF [Gammaproteobacteria bacterium]